MEASIAGALAFVGVLRAGKDFHPWVASSTEVRNPRGEIPALRVNECRGMLLCSGNTPRDHETFHATMRITGAESSPIGLAKSLCARHSSHGSSHTTPTYKISEASAQRVRPKLRGWDACLVQVLLAHSLWGTTVIARCCVWSGFPRAK